MLDKRGGGLLFCDPRVIRLAEQRRLDFGLVGGSAIKYTVDPGAGLL